MNSTEPVTPQTGHGKLGLWDTVCIIVGIVIGTSIFTAPSTIFDNVATPWEGLGVWLIGGIVSLIGALIYAELATTYPRSGGDYVYLTRAFDRPVGFLFGWAQLTVILTGSTGAMAFIFGEYAGPFVSSMGWIEVPESERSHFAAKAAMAAVGALTLINLLGVVLGKWVQNLLALAKLAGLAMIVVAGLKIQDPNAFVTTNHVRAEGGFGLAMILVLYAYGGWNDAAFVAADLRNRRNIPKALIIGTLGITVIYLAVNAAYLLALGFDDACNYRPAIAADVLSKGFGEEGSRIIRVLVMVSALGAMNGLIFTGSRVYSSLGADHRLFAILGRWNRLLNVPIWSLIIQALITVGMIYVVGTQDGRDAVDRMLGYLQISPVPWRQYYGGFNTLFAGTAPVFWIFFLFTGLSLFALRARDPHIERPFKLSMPWYPVLPLIFCATCMFGLYSSLAYAKWISLIGFIPLILGIPLYLLSDMTSRSDSER